MEELGERTSVFYVPWKKGKQLGSFVCGQWKCLTDPPGGVGSRALPLPQSALGGTTTHFESQGALNLEAEQASALNDNQVQVQSQGGSPNARIPRHENAPPGAGFAYPAIGDTDVDVSHNYQKLNKLFFPTAIQFALTMLTVLFSDTEHPLSESAWFLLEFAAGCNIICYICSFSSIFLCRDSTGLAPRILNFTVYASSAFSYISIMGLLLPDNLNLGLTFLGCVACLPALVAAFRGYRYYPHSSS